MTIKIEINDNKNRDIDREIGRDMNRNKYI